MEIGVALPQYGAAVPGLSAGALAAFARGAEDAGLDAVWASDRILTPTHPSHLYPGSGTPEKPYPEAFKVFLDPLEVLTVAATATTRVRLGTSTLNAPFYPPVLLARSLTTLDRLSGGRLDAGFGIGWLGDEYTAVGQDFARRGALLDEALDVLHSMWTAHPVAHEGPRWTVPEAYVGLRPVQLPHPPVYLGGFGPAAMRRIGRRADGWVGIVCPDEMLTALWAAARAAADDAGRDPGALRMHLRYNPGPGETADSVAALLDGVRKRHDPHGVFVDAQQCVETPEAALEMAIRVKELLDAG
ncbi:LLM class F420-dependent oxidoreductase [Mangrovactinospora gilvigrisea]|uniref:LLM class F420-dependent oxidoreductase n=1 Tax=Mangrovactinospora gilvigrisea TaxID=1428644 RepID=A0A1J7BCB5_9ACTN|nr:TIGR03619 family F420-dependent LLM class oxidoreductase [Mangrovactinospora gilvigrisea]OIV36335.1 LLM class F420-dependent oxidoreductase [Mangrovactinospora gilvigrisea]